MNKHSLLLTIGAFILWCTGVSAGIQIEMATRSYPGHFLSLIVAASGSICIISFSQILEYFFLIFPHGLPGVADIQ